MEADTITLQDIYTYESETKLTSQVDTGRFRFTGYVPTFLAGPASATTA